VNRTLRRSCALLVLGGLLVLLGGVSASNSSAVSCPATGFTVALGGVDHVALSQADHSLQATVTAVSNACNNEPVTSYKGPATLTASGTNTGGTPGAAGIVNIALKAGDFKQGIATPKITPTTDALGVRLTATDDANTSIQGTSGAFNVFDDVDDCVDGCDGGIGNSKGPGGTQVSVDLPAGLAGFLGLSLSDAILATGCDGAPTGAVPFGQSYVIAPPEGLGDDTYTATVRFGKKVAPGTGVSNFVHCMATPKVLVEGGPTVMAYERILPCDNKTPDAKCILDQRRNNAGDLVVTFWLGGSDDPGGTGMY
jgi:hypothetical protein